MSDISGVICPLLTPFEADGRIAKDLWIAHALRMLDDGAHYLSPFGTTGEALSIGVDTRMEALSWLVQAGIPAAKLLPGTGVTALADTTRLSQHALDLGAAGVMVLPSFFNGYVGDDGQARYFLSLSKSIHGAPIILYNIPQNSGVPISPSLAARLNAEAPRSFVAYKDSSGDWSNTAAVLSAAPALSVFPGSETFLTKGLAVGAAGCISATMNLNAPAIRALYGAARKQSVMEGQEEVIAGFRAVIQKAGLISAMKAVLAVTQNDPRWLTLLPPHLDARIADGLALIRELAPFSDHLN